ncbi:MAG: hypothetical protein J1F42_10665 [Lachnospiraceae bacterium]|nr:hypothetical protein [Lachnospiraceae bacterium]
MRKGKAFLLALALSGVLVGCGGEKTPEVSSVSIGKDGTITHQIVGGFEQNYYEMDGLKALAADRVAEYCEDNGEGSVTLSSVEEKDGKVLLQLTYATDEDYSGFNNRELFVGTLDEAGKHGYSLEGVAFISAEGEPMELGFMEERDKKQIVIIATKPSEELVVNTYGKVLYINQSATSDLDVSFYGKKGAHVVYPAKENANESVLSYIVFE